MISPTAPVMTCISWLASGEKRRPLLFISSADSTTFTAWSEMRSKSPMMCRIFALVRLSWAVRSLLPSLTR